MLSAPQWEYRVQYGCWTTQHYGGIVAFDIPIWQEYLHTLVILIPEVILSWCQYYGISRIFTSVRIYVIIYIMISHLVENEQIEIEKTKQK